MFETIAPFPLGLLYLMLDSEPEMPDIAGKAALWHTRSVIVTSVLHDSRGKVHLTVHADGPEEALTVLFDDVVASPRRRLELRDAYRHCMASFGLSDEEFPLKIWGDHVRNSRRIHVQCSL